MELQVEPSERGWEMVSVLKKCCRFPPELEMEVDTAEDMAVLEAILAHFAGQREFGVAEIIAFLDANPGLKSLNAAVPRRWKMYRDDV